MQRNMFYRRALEQQLGRFGLTPVEVVVVILVVGVVIALLLPATRSSRSVARRTTCKNNLKQIGLGLHNYADTYNELLPPGVIANFHDGQISATGDVPEAVGSVGWSWGTMILPFIDSAPVYNRIDFNLSIGETVRGTAEAQAQNNRAVAIGFGMARCPTDERVPIADFDAYSGSAPFSVPQGVAATSYYGNAGSFEETLTRAEVMVGDGSSPVYNGGWTNEHMANGVFAVNSSVSLSDIARDGTSQTIGVGEVSRLRDPKSDSNSSWYGAIGPNGTLPDDATLSFLRSGEWKLNADTDESTLAAERGFSSEHVGGAQFLIMDGTVHFISENIQLIPGTKPASGNRGAGQSGCDWAPVDLDSLVESGTVMGQVRGPCGEGVFGVKSQPARDYMDTNYGIYQRLFSRNDCLVIGEY